MRTLRERLFEAMQDPRVAAVMRDPRVQSAVVRAFRYRYRVEGAIERRLERVAARLYLVTQKDLRALPRRIRELERELRDAEERFSDLGDDREARARS